MKKIIVTILLLTLLVSCSSNDQIQTGGVGDSTGTGYTAANAEEQEKYNRAIDAAYWGMPIVSFHAMREAFFRDAGANYGDVVYWSEPGNWKLQVTTPNSSSRYIFSFFNMKEGPVVMDIPPAAGAGLFGSVLDAWQVPIADVGPQGEDKGKGAKYVLLPPAYNGNVPAGYIPLRFNTFNGYAAFRAIPEDNSEAAIQRAIGLAKKVRVYPFAQASNPPASNYIDMSGRPFDGIVQFDNSYYTALAKMVDEEPALARDNKDIESIKSLGITKGQVFSPNDDTRTLLAAAAREAQSSMIRQSANMGDAFYGENAHWDTPPSVGAKTEFSFVVNDTIDKVSRALTYFLACAVPKKVGKASVYLASYFDASGQLFSGEHTYRLRVPPNVPASQFWSANVYDSKTAGFIRESPVVGLDSYDRSLKKNADGSVDLYFGPKAPAGEETNWILTVPGQPWFTLFRFYGPQPAVLDKTWRLPDIEKVS